jgi:hypothetical protein
MAPGWSVRPWRSEVRECLPAFPSPIAVPLTRGSDAGYLPRRALKGRSLVTTSSLALCSATLSGLVTPCMSQVEGGGSRGEGTPSTFGKLRSATGLVVNDACGLEAEFIGVAFVTCHPK